ncbi:hypothetical protein [Hafnia alvei]|jgi:hypothetical protein|nr:hypothetical protein [Hafnia alvei]QBJ32298.1 hypothetical protein EYZ02_04910 [Hafnia alvei]TBL60652.1 hypothetical protein EYY92_10435 [Hafnia alvei]
MKLSHCENELIKIIKNERGYFLSSYQICTFLGNVHPELWKQIQSEYGTSEGSSDMGAGAGQHYSPASYIAHSLEHLSKSYPQIRKEYFSCKGVTFESGRIEPGYTGNTLTIWAWQEYSN